MSLAAPGTNPASNLELKLPHTIGSANQLLKVDGSGQLGWADDSTTDSTKLPLAGGTLTGTLTSNSNINTTGSLSGSNLTLTHGDPKINFVDSGDNPDYQVVVNAGHFMIKDSTASADRLYINASSTTITNNLNVNAGLDVTGTTTSNYLTLSAVNPNITFTDTNDNPDFRITVNSGEFSIEDLTNSATRLKIKADGTMCAGTSGWADVVMRLVLNNPTSGASQMQFQHTGTGTTSTSGFRVGHNGSGGQCWNFENNYFRIATNNAERLRIDSSGNVQIGATSYGGGGANPILYLKSNSGRQFKIHNPDAGTVGLQLTNSGSGEGEDAGLFIAMLSGGGGYIKNNVNNADFMDWYSQVGGSQKYILKVYNDGKHGIQSNTDCLMCSTSQDGTGSNYFLRGSKNSTAPGGGNDVAWIYEDGDMYNANGTFSQSSDVALKENIVDANSQWEDIKGLKFRNFNFKASTGLDTHKQLGLVAQEVELISPGLIKDRDKIVKTTNSDGTVTETTDGTTKSIKLSILYMKGMKALQEAMSRIETLEAKVAALEAG